MQLTTDQITTLAPDAASMKAAQGLSGRAKWPRCGAHENVLWGECQGSGKKPYQVRVDLVENAFKCSCPSRKFPCKHALGLMLLYAHDSAGFQDTDTPEWVTEWIASRQARAEKKQARAEEKAQKPADPKAKAKREDKRRALIRQGLSDLDTWLADRLRAGFSDLSLQPHSFWAEPAARLVDAQAPGLAVFIETIQDIALRRADGWPEEVLAVMGKLKLIIEAFSRYDSLSPEQQADLRAVLGWPLDKDEVLVSGETLSDQWWVLAISTQENQRLRERRTWLQGATSGRMALLLDFAYGTQPFSAHFLPGALLQGALAFYPGAWPLRALFKDTPQALAQSPPVTAASDIASALQSYSRALAHNPWLQRYPLSIQGVIPWSLKQQAGLRDQHKHDLPLAREFQGIWELLALSGGHPLTVFGEWRDNRWLPLAVWGELYYHLGFQN